MTNLYLVYLNRRQAKRRSALGKSAHIVDESMLSKRHLEGKGLAMALEDVSPPPSAQTVDKGFSDTTDLKNEDFIYVY
jgi:hypothetical protein